MTIEKAIEQLEDLIKEAESHMTENKFDDEIFIDDKTALEMAIQALDEITIQALEKQVLKKPIVKLSYICGKKYYCSECKHYICADCNTKKSYCSNCGQALDWSDKNV